METSPTVDVLLNDQQWQLQKQTAHEERGANPRLPTQP
jgi:hypothetical protein